MLEPRELGQTMQSLLLVFKRMFPVNVKAGDSLFWLGATVRGRVGSRGDTMGSFNTVPVLLQMEALQAHQGCIHTCS